MLVALVVVLVILVRPIVFTRWPPGTVFVPRDVPTLDVALAQVSPGQTIVLDARQGPYNVPVLIDVDGITLASTGGAAVVTSTGTDPAIRIRADGVSLSGLHLVGGDVALVLEGYNGLLQDLLIQAEGTGIRATNVRACELSGIEVSGARTGVELISCVGNRLSEWTIDQCGDIGLKLLGSRENVIDSVDISGATVGILLEDGSTANRLRQCRISNSGQIGIRVEASNDSQIEQCDLADGAIGIAVTASTGNRIATCRIDRFTAVGIAVHQSLQCRITSNEVSACAQDGIELTQSTECSVSYNRVSDCEATGIAVRVGERNLILANRLERTGTGIEAVDAVEHRVLRNETMDCDRVGILVCRGEGNQLLDNRVSAARAGMGIVSSRGNIVLRNNLAECSLAAVALLSLAQRNHVAGNTMATSAVGLAVCSTVRSDVLQNRMDGNTLGILLCGAGHLTRIEGNTLRDNDVGLRQDVLPDELLTLIGMVGERDDQTPAYTTTPIIINNVFSANGYDVQNELDRMLYVAGNWRDEARRIRFDASARIQGLTSFEETGWRGQVALAADASDADVLLGRLLQFLLSDRGFRVIDLVGIDTEQRMHDALWDGDADLIWWGLGDEPLDTLAMARDVVVIPVEARKASLLVVSASVASRLTEPTVSAWANLLEQEGSSVRIAVPTSFSRDAFTRFADAYGLGIGPEHVDWTADLQETEARLKFGIADAAMVCNLHETITSLGFVALKDDEAALPTNDVAVVVASELLVQSPDVGALIADVGKRLTTSAVHDLIGRIRLLQADPADVAREFLLDEGLIEE